MSQLELIFDQLQELFEDLNTQTMLMALWFQAL